MNNFKLSGLVLFLAVAQSANAVSDLSCEMKELNGVQSLAVKKGKEVQTYTSARGNKVPMIYNFKVTADASRALTACTDAIVHFACINVVKQAWHEKGEQKVPLIHEFALTHSGYVFNSTYDTREECESARLKRIAGKINDANKVYDSSYSVAETEYWKRKANQRFEIGRP